jgi:Fur family transcriptional regulator, stress-responsive regulator
VIVAANPTELLRQHGIQVTAQRLAVLRAVSERPHISAEDVTLVAGNDIGAISRQAVYDALAVLAEKGIIRRIQPVGSPARYEDRVDDNHHHLICRDCGRLVDVDCAVGAAPCLTASDDNGYEIDEADVAYWGRCPQCQASDLTPNGLDAPPHDRRSKRRISASRSSSPQSTPESDGTHDRY